MDTNKILLHFNILLRQNITVFSKSTHSPKTCQNDVLYSNINTDISSMLGNYTISRIPNFPTSISHTCEKSNIKLKEPLRGVP